MSIKLLDWQKEVVYGNQKRLAVPAGARTGKNIATIFAMKEKPTLTVVPNEGQVTFMQKELSHYICRDGSKIKSNQSFFERLKQINRIAMLDQYYQIIFNELYGLELLSLLQLCDIYDGRIVVMGVPRGIPCPIFYPLSKMNDWVFLDNMFMIKAYGDFVKEINALKNRHNNDTVIREFEAVWA